MTLRLVRDEPPKPARKRRKYLHRPLLSADEEKRFRQAIKNLRDAFGTLGALAAAMDAPENTVATMLRGAHHVSGDLIVRASKASGLTLVELLGAPALAGTCRACGSVRRAS